LDFLQFCIGRMPDAGLWLANGLDLDCDDHDYWLWWLWLDLTWQLRHLTGESERKRMWWRMRRGETWENYVNLPWKDGQNFMRSAEKYYLKRLTRSISKANRKSNKAPKSQTQILLAIAVASRSRVNSSNYYFHSVIIISQNNSKKEEHVTVDCRIHSLL
jgi:hypothetical protein